MKHLYTCFLIILLTTLSFLPAPALADVDYFTITAVEANVTVKITHSGSLTTAPKFSYSTDNGANWTTLSLTSSSTNVTITTLASIGDKVILKGNNNTNKGLGNVVSGSAAFWYFTIDKNVSLSGNLMSLITEDATATTIPSTYCFFKLFQNCKITDISQLNLAATTLTYGCYEGMFYNCSTLTSAMEELPATTLATYCYNYMFQGCNITAAPALPATTMVDYCYNKMFYNCHALTVAPELPATTLADHCYSNMFFGCSALTSAPALSATPATFCYQEMFASCTSLTTAPELPSTTLAKACYLSMFNGCTSLTTAPDLPATTLIERCYKQMFKGCTSLETAPVIKATALPTNNTADYGCMEYMFQNCTALKNVKVYFTEWDNGTAHNNTKNATYQWMYGTTKNANRTFLCPCALPDENRGDNRIQTSWTRKCFYVYTFDANSGTWDGTDNAARTIDRVSDETLSALPEAQKTGYRFIGWNTAADGTGDALTLDNQTGFTADATFYAQYEKIPAYTFDVAATGGTWDGTDADSRVLYAELPDDTPQKEGNNFTGWNTETDGSGEAITADNISSFTADATFYAQWQPQLIELDDTQDNTALLASLNGVSCDVLLAGRTLVGGCVNTLCLPFGLTEEQMEASPLNGCTIWQFNSSSFDGETLSIDVSEAASITAGVPYLVEPATAVSDLRFNGVTISTSTASTCGNSTVRFVGLLSPFTLTAGSEDQLFVGAGNKLLRPSTSSALRGFRAWFRLNDGQALAAPRARLTFGEKPQLPTAIDGTENDNTPRKIMINGQLYITSDGTTYTPAGNIMPK